MDEVVQSCSTCLDVNFDDLESQLGVVLGSFCREIQEAGCCSKSSEPEHFTFTQKNTLFSPIRLPNVQTLKPNLVSLPTISWSREQPVLDWCLEPHTHHQLLTKHTHFMITPSSVTRFRIIQKCSN